MCIYLFHSGVGWKNLGGGVNITTTKGRTGDYCYTCAARCFWLGNFCLIGRRVFIALCSRLYTAFVDNGNMPINEYMPKRNKKWGSHGWPQKNVPLMNDIRFDRKCYVIPPFIWEDDSWTERSYSKLMHSILKRRLDIENKRKGYNKFERGKAVFWRTFQLRFSQCSSSFFIFLFFGGKGWNKNW